MFNLLPKPRRTRDDGFSLIEVIAVLAIIAALGAFTVPLMGNMLGYFKLSGDVRNVSNSIAMAKMRAASLFTQTRLYVDLGAKTFHVDLFQKTPPAWIQEGGTTQLAAIDSFGFGSIAVPPPNSQTTIAQSPVCLTAAGAVIAGTSCIVFNSRGLPVDATGTPTGIDAFYLTDGTETYGITMSATGMLRVWRTPAHTTPTWALQ